MLNMWKRNMCESVTEQGVRRKESNKEVEEL
jgi:hypothetical protein